MGIARTIVNRQYNSMFGQSYGDLSVKVNYKLGINIKVRSRRNDRVNYIY